MGVHIATILYLAISSELGQPILYRGLNPADISVSYDPVTICYRRGQRIQQVWHFCAGPPPETTSIDQWLSPIGDRPAFGWFRETKRTIRVDWHKKVTKPGLFAFHPLLKIESFRGLVETLESTTKL